MRSAVVSLLLLLTAVAHAQTPASIQGIILDGRDGQALPAVSISILEQNRQVRSDTSGRFTIPDIPPGDYIIQISAPGYTRTQTPFHLASGEAKTFEVSLSPDILHHTEIVAATLPFATDPDRKGAGDQGTLQGAELTNLTSVLTDDPYRAVQALPGVASNNDFDAQFSLRGASFDRTGTYLDGVLIPNALHSLEGSGLIGSASFFNPFLVDSVTLNKSAYSEKFENSSAGAVEVETRDGDPDRYHVRAMANIAQAGAEADGPFGHFNTCSWIGAYRESYIGALLGNKIPDPSLAFGTKDTQGRVSCHITPKNTVNVDFVDSYTDLNRTATKSNVGASGLLVGTQRLTFGQMEWTYSPTDRVVIATHAAWMQDAFKDEDAAYQPMGRGSDTEKYASSAASWMISSTAVLSGGFDARQISENGFTAIYYYPSIKQLNIYNGRDILDGEYLQQTWNGFSGRLHLMAGFRAEHDSTDGRTTISPQGAIAIRLVSSLELQLGFGQYVQFPAVSVLSSNLGNRALLPIRSNQATAALEQGIGKNTRVRMEFYDRQDGNLLDQPYLLPRLIAGKVFFPPANPLYSNSLGGFGRGAEFYLQRSMTKRLSGWISYSYGRSMLHESLLATWYPSDFDQRHTLNAYAAYTLKPSVTFSARWTYGSGFPIPEYLQEGLQGSTGPYYLSSSENQTRLPAYRRLDFRLNKTWNHEAYKIRLYAEVLNLTNASNFAFGSVNAVYSNPKAKQDVTIQQLFPILPAVGVVFER